MSTVILLYFLLLYNQPVVSVYWKRCFPDKTCVCAGTNNGRTYAGSPNRLEDYTKMYQNCSRVHGNLEITHLTQNRLNWTDKEMKQLLDIFDHIVEVKGYVLIYNVDIDKLSFKRLEIIWADDLFMEDSASHEPAGLMISSNHKLKEIYMPSLKSVEKGVVKIHNNSFLCYLNHTVNWNEILNLEASTRLVRPSNAHRQCQVENKFNCHPECESGFCWGRSLDKCQALYRTLCPNCPSKQCYYSNTTNLYQCCAEDCAGGCSGPTADKCRHCKQFQEDGRCVSSCAPLRIMRKGQLTENPNGRYLHDRYCVQQCPEHYLIEEGACVQKCSEGSYHNGTTNTRMCEKCKDNLCPKVCRVSGALTKAMLSTLHNCSEIEGHLNIQESKIGSGPTDMDLSELNILRSVKLVTEYIQMTTSTKSPWNMSFLENLEVIEGRKLVNDRFALAITMNDNLQQLQLKSLRSIRDGSVIIKRNHQLCMADSVNWSALMRQNTTVKIAENKDSQLCGDRGLKCDANCDAGYGCWGMGNDQCLRCKSWSKDGECLNECPPKGYFANETSMVCMPCVAGCKKCSGPLEGDCLECTKVSLLTDDHILKCFNSCPEESHFESANGKCIKCHPACGSYGCYGPSDKFGPEKRGCKKCQFAKLSPNNNGSSNKTIEKCLLYSGAQSELCSANKLTRYFVSSSISILGVTQAYCAECHEQCLTCRSDGPGRNAGCVCKNFKQYEGTQAYSCVAECDTKRSYMEAEKTDGKAGICQPCHSTCDGSHGCTGPAATQCGKCMDLQYTTGNITECVTECPPTAPFTSDYDFGCHSSDVDAQKRFNKGLVIASVLFGFILLVFIISIFAFRYRKNLKKLHVAESEKRPEIPEMMELDPSVKPNFSKITVIPFTDLDKKKELGHGEFGCVYKGIYNNRAKNHHIPVAIKAVRSSGYSKKLRANEQKELLEEASKMARLHHQHLLGLIGIAYAPEGIELITPLRPSGDLKKYLKANQNCLGGRDLLVYCYQITSAMKYLHSENVLHCDLAARNVLVKRPNHVEVTDFGLSKLINHGEESVKKAKGKTAIRWLAPEVIGDRWSDYLKYNKASDVWAFGVTAWEILTYGQNPYQGLLNDEILSRVEEGHRLEQPAICSVELYHALLECWFDEDSRSNFIILNEKFRDFCKIPNLYVGNTSQSNALSLWESAQVDLTHDLLEDGDDFQLADPLTYFDMGQSCDLPSPTGQPGQVFRMPSVTSQRYQFDSGFGFGPSTSSSMSTERPDYLATDSNQYLVPNGRIEEHQATIYTPVVIYDKPDCEGGDLVPHTYVNTPTSDGTYVNDATNSLKTGKKSQDKDKLVDIAEENNDVTEIESCL